MLDLSPETEKLARRIAAARRLSVDETVRDALQAHECLPQRTLKKDMSPEGIASRIAATEKIVSEIAALPILDPRPLQEIIDDINAI